MTTVNLTSSRPRRNRESLLRRMIRSRFTSQIITPLLKSQHKNEKTLKLKKYQTVNLETAIMMLSFRPNFVIKCPQLRSLWWKKGHRFKKWFSL